MYIWRMLVRGSTVRWISDYLIVSTVRWISVYLIVSTVKVDI